MATITKEQVDFALGLLTTQQKADLLALLTLNLADLDPSNFPTVANTMTLNTTQTVEVGASKTFSGPLIVRNASVDNEAANVGTAKTLIDTANVFKVQGTYGNHANALIATLPDITVPASRPVQLYSWVVSLADGTDFIQVSSDGSGDVGSLDTYFSGDIIYYTIPSGPFPNGQWNRIAGNAGVSVLNSKIGTTIDLSIVDIAAKSTQAQIDAFLDSKEIIIPDTALTFNITLSNVGSDGLTRTKTQSGNSINVVESFLTYKGVLDYIHNRIPNGAAVTITLGSNVFAHGVNGSLAGLGTLPLRINRSGVTTLNGSGHTITSIVDASIPITAIYDTDGGGTMSVNHVTFDVQNATSNTVVLRNTGSGLNVTGLSVNVAGAGCGSIISSTSGSLTQVTQGTVAVPYSLRVGGVYTGTGGIQNIISSESGSTTVIANFSGLDADQWRAKIVLTGPVFRFNSIFHHSSTGGITLQGAFIARANSFHSSSDTVHLAKIGESMAGAGATPDLVVGDILSYSDLATQAVARNSTVTNNVYPGTGIVVSNGAVAIPAAPTLAGNDPDVILYEGVIDTP